MNLSVSGHHLDVTPAIRTYVQSKLERVTRHFDHVIDAHVILTVDKLRRKEALGAFIRVAQPVPFDAPDGNAVTLVFVLLVPEKATEKHLQILSELAQMFSDKVLREAMTRAPDAAALHQLVTAWQPDAAGQRRAAA